MAMNKPHKPNAPTQKPGKRPKKMATVTLVDSRSYIKLEWDGEHPWSVVTTDHLIEQVPKARQIFHKARNLGFPLEAARNILLIWLLADYNERLSHQEVGLVVEVPLAAA